MAGAGGPRKDLLAAAIAKVAQAHAVAHDDAVVRRSLDSFSDFFFGDSSFIQFRLAKKGSQTQLNYRAELFGDEAASTLLHVLRRDQLDAKYMWGVLDQLDTSACAVDCDPGAGLVKVWQFGNYTLEQLVGVEGAPTSLHAHADLFRNRGALRIYCTGVDLIKNSINVYCNLRDLVKTVADVLLLFHDLGFEPPADKTTLDLLAGGSGAFAMTLGLGEGPNFCERVCFYMAPDSYADLPSDWKQFMDQCVNLPHENDQLLSIQGAPVDRSAHDNACFVSCSFGQKLSEKYFKIESDWHGSYHELLRRVATKEVNPEAVAQEDAYRAWQRSAPIVAAIQAIVASPRILGSHAASEVMPGFLYLGSAKDANDLQWLKESGVTHVLNCADKTAKGDSSIFEELSLEYCQLDAMDDDEFDMIESCFPMARQFIGRAEAAAGGKILVHCHAGVNRSATIVCAYLMDVHKMNVLDAVLKVACLRLCLTRLESLCTLKVVYYPSLCRQDLGGATYRSRQLQFRPAACVTSAATRRPGSSVK